MARKIPQTIPVVAGTKPLQSTGLEGALAVRMNWWAAFVVLFPLLYWRDIMHVTELPRAIALVQSH